MNEYMKNRYRERRQIAYEILGNKCAKCGETENLEIDHINRLDKVFDFSKLWNIALEKFKTELKKCQLLCKDCHKRKTSLELSVPHGGGLTGKRNCYCELCKPLKRKYNNENRILWR